MFLAPKLHVVTDIALYQGALYEGSSVSDFKSFDASNASFVVIFKEIKFSTQLWKMPVRPRWLKVTKNARITATFHSLHVKKIPDFLAVLNLCNPLKHQFFVENWLWIVDFVRNPRLLLTC